MYWLWRAYVAKFKFWSMAIPAVFLPGLIAFPAGRYLGKLFDVDNQLFIGGLYFVFLAVEVYLAERIVDWWQSRPRS